MRGGTPDDDLRAPTVPDATAADGKLPGEAQLRL
jgi:hypothetical protein